MYLNKVALTIEEVRKIASLARLRLSAEEEGRFVVQLGAIVDYIDQLRGYETATTGGQSPGVEAEDRVAACLPLQAVIDNAPESHGPFLVVPQVKAGDDG